MIRVFNDPESLLEGLADYVVRRASDAISSKGRFDFVLSGGSSPKRLFELLASVNYSKKIEWKKVFFFFGDERFVPLDQPESNFRMARLAMLEPLHISDQQIFAVNTTVSATAAASDYEARIRKHFGSQPCRFDLILLGLGDDAHTASLFPHSDILKENKALVEDAFVQKVNMHRITFTFPLINAAAAVAFLVYGASKATAIKNVLEGPNDVDTFPAQGVKPDGELIWFMDKPAASRLVNQ